MAYAAMETVLKKGVDIVCLQEPARGRAGDLVSHPGFHIFKSQPQEGRLGRVWTAVRLDAPVIVEERSDLGCTPDVQTFDVYEKKKRNGEWRKGRRTRLVNVYDQNIRQEGQPRRAIDEVNWATVIRGRTILCGDFNAHSPVWGCRRRQNHTTLERLIDEFNLNISNIEQPTWIGDGTKLPSNIDLTLSTGHIVADWAVMEDDEDGTLSDHEILIWDAPSEDEENSGGAHRSATFTKVTG